LKKQNKAYLFALGAVGLWSTVATAFKIALNSVDFIQLLFYSTLTAFVVLFVIIIAENRLQEIKSLNIRAWSFSILRGFLNPFLYYLILFKAYDILPANEAMSLNYTWPIMLVLLAAPILKQKINAKGLLAIMISFLGVMLIATKGRLFSFHFDNPFGDFLAIFSSIIWALFWLSNMKSKESETLKLFLSFGFGLIFITPVLFIFSSFKLPNFESLIAIIYVGIAEMGIAFYLWLNALQLSDRADKVSKLIFLSPVISLFIISLVLKEKIGIFTFVGLAFILTGIALKDKKGA